MPLEQLFEDSHLEELTQIIEDRDGVDQLWDSIKDQLSTGEPQSNISKLKKIIATTQKVLTQAGRIDFFKLKEEQAANIFLAQRHDDLAKIYEKLADDLENDNRLEYLDLVAQHRINALKAKMKAKSDPSPAQWFSPLTTLKELYESDPREKHLHSINDYIRSAKPYIRSAKPRFSDANKLELLNYQFFAANHLQDKAQFKKIFEEMKNLYEQIEKTGTPDNYIRTLYRDACNQARKNLTVSRERPADNVSSSISVSSQSSSIQSHTELQRTGSRVPVAEEKHANSRVNLSTNVILEGLGGANAGKRRRQEEDEDAANKKGKSVTSSSEQDTLEINTSRSPLDYSFKEPLVGDLEELGAKSPNPADNFNVPDMPGTGQLEYDNFPDFLI